MSFNPVRTIDFWATLRWAGLGILVGGTPVSSVHAEDASVSQTVTTAFETIVIDATTAATKATAAAKAAVAAKKDKKAKKDTKGADPSKEDTAKSDAAKSEKAKSDSAKTDGDKSAGHPGTDAADKAKQPGAAPAEPAAKSADGKPVDPKAKNAGPPTEWPAVDVELARARCTQLLKGVDAVTVPEAPFRKGDCGTMAPVRLLSIGKSPEISFSPPPVITCDLVVGLVKWMKDEVQPAARRHLGAEVIRVDSMSDYSCRMAYGRVGNKLSEHGKANALDIRSFTTRKGAEAIVLKDWGQTKRDVRKEIAAAKAAAEKAEAVKLAAEKAAKERAQVAEYTAKAENTGTVLPRKSLVEGLPPRKDETPPLAVPASVNQEWPARRDAAWRSAA